VIPLESATYEKRALGHAKIDVNGRVVDFFNTHLSYEDTTTRSYQFYAVSEKLIECKDFILTGDFNTSDFSEFLILGGNLLNNTSRSYPTFPGSSKPIDNIVFSDSFKEISSGTVTKSYSDHYMLWAEFTLN
jgi:endonuclease/exonuclease/phosphatase family metal-dependent hydrolase